MTTVVTTSFQGTPSLGSACRVQIRDASTGTVLQARTNTGVREDVAASGFYVWSGVLATAPGYSALWDEGGASFSAATAAGEIVLAQQVLTPTVQLSAGTVVPGVWRWKRHDTREPITFQASELLADGVTIQPIDITGGTILFKMRTVASLGSASALKTNAAGTILDGPTGWMQYQPIGADTDTAGQYLAEFQVTFPDGRIQTFPITSDETNEYIQVHIIADLDVP